MRTWAVVLSHPKGYIWSVKVLWRGPPLSLSVSLEERKSSGKPGWRFADFANSADSTDFLDINCWLKPCGLKLQPNCQHWDYLGVFSFLIEWVCFTMALTLVGQWSWRHQLRMWLTDWSSHWTNISAMVCNCSKAVFKYTWQLYSCDIIDKSDSSEGSDSRQDQTCLQDIATVCISSRHYSEFNGPLLV